MTENIILALIGLVAVSLPIILTWVLQNRTQNSNKSDHASVVKELKELKDSHGALTTSVLSTRTDVNDVKADVRDVKQDMRDVKSDVLHLKHTQITVDDARTTIEAAHVETRNEVLGAVEAARTESHADAASLGSTPPSVVVNVEAH